MRIPWDESRSTCSSVGKQGQANYVIKIGGQHVRGPNDSGVRSLVLSAASALADVVRVKALSLSWDILFEALVYAIVWTIPLALSYRHHKLSLTHIHTASAVALSYPGLSHTSSPMCLECM